jgi:hypothetical protein
MRRSSTADSLFIKLSGMTLTAVSEKWGVSRSLVCKLVNRKIVLQSLGPGIDSKCLAALENWHFHPSTRNGAPIPSKTGRHLPLARPRLGAICVLRLFVQRLVSFAGDQGAHCWFPTQIFPMHL